MDVRVQRESLHYFEVCLTGSFHSSLRVQLFCEINAQVFSTLNAAFVYQT